MENTSDVRMTIKKCEHERNGKESFAVYLTSLFQGSWFQRNQPGSPKYIIPVCFQDNFDESILSSADMKKESRDQQEQISVTLHDNILLYNIYLYIC
jgi:hypothetical protein